jgi:hypothetical protein
MLLSSSADGGLTLYIQKENPGVDKEQTGYRAPEGHS